MKKKIGLVMLFMVLLIGTLSVVYASTHTGSAQWKNKNYSVSYSGSKSKCTVIGTFDDASTTLVSYSDTYKTGVVTVACYEYVTATKVVGATDNGALQLRNAVVVSIDRVPNNSNYKYEHSATLREYNFGAVVDSYTYTAWQNI